jgi:hypothetical protein
MARDSSHIEDTDSHPIIKVHQRCAWLVVILGNLRSNTTRDVLNIDVPTNKNYIRKAI